ncbi:hypothetical protein SM033_00281 [Vibrio phage vB_VpaM_sm033]|nr:hypothetical protein SM033_00281 [Vibrio phage vB_VpaM_sm033]
MKEKIVAGLLIALGSFSFNTEASTCETGGCGDSNSNLSGSQNQSQYNTLQQSPTMALNSSQSNTVLNASHATSGSISHSADGGISFSGSCPTNTLVVNGGYGENDSESFPTNYRSESNNAYVNVGVVIPWGQAVDDCNEGEALKIRTAKFAYTKLQISTCLVFMQQGISLDAVAKMSPEFAICPKVAMQAEQNMHGRIGRQAVEQYKKNMQAQGINPYKTFAK